MDSLYFMDRGLILATLSMEMGVFVDRVIKLESTEKGFTFISA